ncbi:MAG: toll/interleukin-1 receptor domain-containing protein [Bifidobacterium crudilactis]|uniref:toll/interleukin-1 receptor domain-containing protein n=1 Tax=Bifidobacterium crudilactis TaxID=327277 RepID=UPI003F9CD73D
MSADLFISYAWTSDQHREWVRLLAAQLKAIGYDVLIDADLDYGDGLNGFMRRVTDCRHVLLIVDENYVQRANTLPKSGVGIETKWISEAHGHKPSPWLSVLFRSNPTCLLPDWLEDHNPKGHLFNANPSNNDFPGSEQVEELWRWIEDLPANRDHAVSAVTLRERGKRLEVIERQRDPNAWSTPATQGEIHFEYDRAPNKTYSLGYGQFTFKLAVSGCGAKSVYVYKDPIHAVGLNRSQAVSKSDLAAQLTPGRTVVMNVGQEAILQNQQGALCLIALLDCQQETTSPTYMPASIRFNYRILLDS